jgi:alkylation response protein AidB-like acyl-CoA dehydrogenase
MVQTLRHANRPAGDRPGSPDPRGLRGSKGYLVEKLYREIRPMRIRDGTSEIQHLVIANQLLKE